MQIVIEIDEQRFIGCKILSMNWAEEAIASGTPLLEHHEWLIEKINSKKTYKGRASYSDMHDADMDKIYDIALDKAIEIIKEYCKEDKE